jgi:outer membrane protein assembly factor BamB
MMAKLCIPILLCALVTSSRADEFKQDRLDQWPQWRGPNGDGTAPRGDPPVEWSESKNVRWKVELPGSGSATPVVWGEKIFVLTASDTGRKAEAKVEPAPAGAKEARSVAPTTIYKFEVLCLDRKTGKELWRRTAVEDVPHEGHHSTHGYASASPVTDGALLYASFGSRGVFCYDLDGALKWKRDLGRMQIKMGFGEGSSPALHADSLVVNWDHEAGSFIACLDAKTGDEKWRTKREEGTTWTSPLVVERDGIAQVIVNGTNKTRSYDLAGGKLVWECGGQVMNPIAMPVLLDGMVYCMTGYRGFSVTAIRLDSKGDVTGNTRQVVWKRSDAAPYVASPLLSDGLLYLTKERQGILSCVDAKTGELRYEGQRLPGIETVYASLTGAAGRLYIPGREGTTAVIQQGPTYKLLAANKLDEAIDASPVIIGKQLFLRGSKHLYCIATD